MEKTRFKMLTRWLTFMAFLAGSANVRSADSDRRAATVAPTCRVEGQPEVELILNCGDGTHEGWVQLWHTPVGDLQPSSGHTNSVFVHPNGSLVIPRPGLLHSGLYSCVQQHSEGSTLWPYELHVSHFNQNTDDEHEQDKSRAALRTRRTAKLEEQNGAVLNGTFAGAVVASVLVTFVVGFSAGALARAYVLRCWHAVTTRLRSPKQRRQAATPDRSAQIVITTLPPTRGSHAFETETARDGSPIRGNPGGRASVTTPSPPAKPKRSFRNREEKTRDTAYLEGCDYAEEERMKEAEGGVGAIKKGSDEEETTQSCFYLEDEELQGETEEDKIDEREEKEEVRGGVGEFKRSDEEENPQSFFYLEDEELQSETDEDKIDEREEKEAAGGEQEKRSKEEVRGEREEEKTEVKETECCEEFNQSSADERGAENKETTMEEEEATSSAAPRRRSRVIRVYQYDEEGQRYCHLPDPGPQGPEPTPKLRQRSLSLTRLNAIMAAAAAGPMEAREGEETPHFHMEI